jgi:hypothetical protein
VVNGHVHTRLKIACFWLASGNSADYMQGTTMRFRTKEEAIHFVSMAGAFPAKVVPRDLRMNRSITRPRSKDGIIRW